jgi:hypothetical protein
MDLSSGFQIEDPSVLIRWGIAEAELEGIFGLSALRRVTDGYYVIPCYSLGGLRHKLGFHFDPRVGGRLVELEFFEAYSQEPSFQAFQRHLEATFGPPTQTAPGTEGFLSHFWRVPGAEISHYVRDHFGPEENVRIKRKI